MDDTENEDWNRVLKPLITEGEVCLDDLDLTDSRRETVERVLDEMTGIGWLERDTDREATWKPGELADLHLTAADA